MSALSHKRHYLYSVDSLQHPEHDFHARVHSFTLPPLSLAVYSLQSTITQLIPTAFFTSNIETNVSVRASMQQPTSDEPVRPAAEQPNKPPCTGQQKAWIRFHAWITMLLSMSAGYRKANKTFNLNNVVHDRFNQLPALPIELPNTHQHFLHCMPPKPPTYRKYSVFFAGSIEMGEAVQWQQRMALELFRYPITVTNPRREQWDKNKDSMEEQIDWELAALDQADVVCFFVDVATKSPVTMLELGLKMDSDKIIVCCGEQYFRSTNVYLTCKRYGVPVVKTFTQLSIATTKMLQEKGMELDGNGDLIGNNTHVPKSKPISRLEMKNEIATLEK